MEPDLRDRLVRVETIIQHHVTILDEVRGDVKLLLAAVNAGSGVISFFKTVPGLIVASVSFIGFVLAVVK